MVEKYEIYPNVYFVLNMDSDINDTTGYIEKNNKRIELSGAPLQELIRLLQSNDEYIRLNKSSQKEIQRCREIIGDKDRQIIISKNTYGYKLAMKRLVKDAIIISKEIPRRQDPLIGRADIINSIIQYFTETNANKRFPIMLVGESGIGKTAIAEHCLSILSDRYDWIGWIRYDKDIKNSFTSSLNEVYFVHNQNETVRVSPDSFWNLIHLTMLNNKKHKILFVIDNFDVNKNQDPRNDLTLISTLQNWKSVDIIITSKIADGVGFRELFNVFPVPSLTIQECVALFYHYHTQAIDKTLETDRIVHNLITMAEKNTLIIELLAKSSFHTPLKMFMNTLIEKDFKALDKELYTHHSKTQKTEQKASHQIALLYDLSSRDHIEHQIITCFKLLPETFEVTAKDLRDYFDFSFGEISRLCEEHWIYFFPSTGSYKMHPLVRKAMSLYNDIDSVSNRVMLFGHLNVVIYKNIKKHLSHNASISELNHALTIIDCFVGNNTLNVAEYIYIADLARKSLNYSLALKYYAKAGVYFHAVFNDYMKKLHVPSDTFLNSLTPDSLLQYWKSKYYSGYILSFTSDAIYQAEKELRIALDICDETKNQPSIKNDDNWSKNHIKTLGHYAYVLSMRHDLIVAANHPNSTEHHSEIPHLFSDDLFSAYIYALAAREEAKSILDKAPDDISKMRDYSWALDNYGLITAKIEALYNHPFYIYINRKITWAWQRLFLPTKTTPLVVHCLYSCNDEILKLEHIYPTRDVCEHLSPELSFDNIEELCKRKAVQIIDFVKNNKNKYISSDCLREAMDIRKQLLERNRECLSYKSELAWTQSNLIYALGTTPDNEEIISLLFNDSVKLYQEIEQAAPYSSADLARPYTYYARFLHNTGRSEKALPLYEEALRIYHTFNKYTNSYQTEIKALEFVINSITGATHLSDNTEL